MSTTANYELLDQWLNTFCGKSIPDRARVMMVTAVTYRSWKASGQVPSYVPFFCVGYRALKARPAPGEAEAFLVKGERLSVQQVQLFMNELDIKSQNDLAYALRMTKQAVSKWFVNERFPKWLGVTLCGLMISRQKSLEGVLNAPETTFFLKNIEKVATVASQTS